MPTTRPKSVKKTANKKSAQPKGSGAGNSQLQKLFHDSLKDIYWAEKALTKSLG